MGGKYVTVVQKKKRTSTKILLVVMALLAVLFCALAILFTTGYMMLCFLTALMYFVFESNANKTFEYVYEEDCLYINVKKPYRKMRTLHVLRMKDLEVIAPPTDESVKMYRKDAVGTGGGVPIKKYDYTSYDDAVLYYTMIILEDGVKTKFLMDFEEEMLQAIRFSHPGKVRLYNTSAMSA